jgi:hypothetical protein
MRKSVLMGAILLPPAAIGFAQMIRASAQTALKFCARLRRALGVLVATRTQRISA